MAYFVVVCRRVEDWVLNAVVVATAVFVTDVPDWMDVVTLVRTVTTGFGRRAKKPSPMPAVIAIIATTIAATTRPVLLILEISTS